ncbi:MAG: hypothetical protein LBI62_00770 [Candidatus Accumulibacter sp.]|jgi:hypothetical protein|nr:hypothetical protein [Accumulibacter sp.]
MKSSPNDPKEDSEDDKLLMETLHKVLHGDAGCDILHNSGTRYGMDELDKDYQVLLDSRKTEAYKAFLKR